MQNYNGNEQAIKIPIYSVISHTEYPLKKIPVSSLMDLNQFQGNFVLPPIGLEPAPSCCDTSRVVTLVLLVWTLISFGEEKGSDLYYLGRCFTNQHEFMNCA